MEEPTCLDNFIDALQKEKSLDQGLIDYAIQQIFLKAATDVFGKGKWTKYVHSYYDHPAISTNIYFKALHHSKVWTQDLFEWLLERANRQDLVGMLMLAGGIRDRERENLKQAISSALKAFGKPKQVLRCGGRKAI